MNNLIEDYAKELADVAVFAVSTVETYTSSVRKYCDFAQTTCYINPLDSKGRHLQAWLQILRPTISRSRLRQHQYALKSFFAFLFKNKKIAADPAEVLPQLRKKKSMEIQPITAKEAFGLLAVIEQTDWLGLRNHLIFSTLWCLGLRISELTGLQVKSFEPEHDPAHKIGLLRIRGKNKKQRALFVVDTLYDQFMAYLDHPQSPGEKEQPLFPVKQGKAISSNRIQKMLQEYIRKTKLKSRITPHILRHSFATEMYKQDVPFSAIQAMLGHEKKEETALYVHIPEEMKKKALAQVTIAGGDSWQ